MYKRKQYGFTIVELLIVIVVIAILAAITIVAYNGIQQRGKDSARKSDLATISKALKLYQIDEGDFAESKCGSGGTSSYGWLPSDYDATGPLISINSCLINGGYLRAAITDPSGLGSCSGLTCFAYMKASCPGATYLYAHLETLPQASTDLDGTCQPSWDTAYGMNYVVRVN